MQQIPARGREILHPVSEHSDLSRTVHYSPPQQFSNFMQIGSRICIPTCSYTEPFKYGVIRWIGEVSITKGALVAGIELVSCTSGNILCEPLRVHLFIGTYIVSIG